ncbi:uncharacterized protein [Ptychodera flava]|uniref:uncharacterized protein n=1 Tax=Ptychodera flava TaxID=63121 RepID=UPI003969C1FE
MSTKANNKMAGQDADAKNHYTGSLRVPYHCISIDAKLTDTLAAMRQCIYPSGDRQQLIESLKKQWTTPHNRSHVLPCLCVRTAFDLYLRVMKYPPGSEIIMSGVNIPDMGKIIRHHAIRIVSIDINIDTLSPKVELLESLISERTVAVLVAHVYGKWFEMDDVIEIAHRHGLHVLEDCAEAFRGSSHCGHPDADLSFFSFGVIKTSTAFGGAIVKIKDLKLYQSMVDMYKTYPIRPNSEYFKKVLKYAILIFIMNASEWRTALSTNILRFFEFDYKKLFVDMLRGFPKDFFVKIRHQPSTPLLYMMYKRISRFKESSMNESRQKGDYVTQRLPSSVGVVGSNASIKNYWLFPVLVENPEEVCKELNDVGVDAVTGPTSLQVVEPCNGSDSMEQLSDLITHYPEEAKFLIDHVMYLPVHKNVTYHQLDRLVLALELVLKKLAHKKFTQPSFEAKQLFVDDTQVKIPLKSKL